MLTRRDALGIMAACASERALAYSAAGGVISAPDPLIINPTTVANGANVTAFTDTTGKSSATLPAAASTHLVLVIAGQSNMANTFTSAYTPTHTGHVFNFNIFNGLTYAAADPLLGCTRSGAPYGDGNMAGRIADKLLTAGPATDVTLVPIAVDASSCDDWNNGALRTYFRTTYARLRMRGLTATAILWGQGETDTFLGTGQGAYGASLSALIARTREYGFTCPWFVAQETMYTNSTSSAIRAAQAGVVDHASGIWAGPDADTLTGATNRDTVITPTNTHFTDTGSDACAALWVTKLQAFGAPFA